MSPPVRSALRATSSHRRKPEDASRLIIRGFFYYQGRRFSARCCFHTSSPPSRVVTTPSAPAHLRALPHEVLEHALDAHAVPNRRDVLLHALHVLLPLLPPHLRRRLALPQRVLVLPQRRRERVEHLRAPRRRVPQRRRVHRPSLLLLLLHLLPLLLPRPTAVSPVLLLPVLPHERAVPYFAHVPVSHRRERARAGVHHAEAPEEVRGVLDPPRPHRKRRLHRGALHITCSFSIASAGESFGVNRSSSSTSWTSR